MIRVTGDWGLAEDCVQDAVERALARWPSDGVPDNPAAWLTTTAYRRALDVLRRRRTEAATLTALAALEAGPTPDPHGYVYRDDRLRLMFTCCHPALPLAGQVALTLKTVAGLSIRQIARAFLVSEATMGQRLLRTRAKIAHAGIPMRVPEPHRLAERTAGVLAVVYLVFNQGYDDPADGLAGAAVRLAGLLTTLLPGDDEALGLHALLLLQHARRAARVDATGELVPLGEQDRRRWDGASIADGLAVLTSARGSGRAPGPYRLQAEIAAVHATTPDADATDWPAVVRLYDVLLGLAPSPVVALNRAVAVAYRDGPAAGLSAVDEVAGQLGGYPPLAAVRADLLRRVGDSAGARSAYDEAVALAPTEAERRYLERRRSDLRVASSDGYGTS